MGANGLPTLADYNPQDPAIVYETERMREDLLANRDKPIGTSFVFTDRPESTLYLTVVSDRRQLSPDAFREYILYADIDRVKQTMQRIMQQRQFREQLRQLGIPDQGDTESMPLTPEAVSPRYAVSARAAARAQAVALLKAEFGYTNENTKKLEEKTE